ncbi:MAG: NAD(P)H-dependent oxidoreductase subunit E [Victivallales bacterium]|nr:NAD(P)H-dependent oxidoreductase subunit E [Victivallales bacterium]
MTTTPKDLKKEIADICKACGNDRSRLMDIVRDVQEKFGCVSDEAINLIASEVSVHRVEVESVVSFYAFLSKDQKGNFVIRVCDDIIDRQAGSDSIISAFEKELGINCGETTADGKFTLEKTPCIGMCDQAPAIMINDEIVTNLTADKAGQIISTLKESGDPKKLVAEPGDGNNGNPLVNSMVMNNIHQKGEIVFSEYVSGAALKEALSSSPKEVIRNVKAASLRGRGGAGFPTGMKWDFTRAAEGDKKAIICNADEGEPGTFKDRAILTECPDMVFEGMTIAGYAIGADTGILYLRGEYAYLRKFLEEKLAKRRENGLLGKNISPKKRLGGLLKSKSAFDFDIRIQMGAGAYVCGEETALISSCEGSRGDPKTRPPFPAQKGYLGLPTCVNNVETLACVVKIIEKGAAWFAARGSAGSKGTKVLSISGDCEKPGVYELPFGTTVSEVLEKTGAKDTAAVQMGGPSGTLVAANDFGRKICYDDLATGGSIMVFSRDRNLLEVVDYFMEFFIEESCGYCTPCRVGNVLLKDTLEKIINGKGLTTDISNLESLGKTVKLASRCGLGQTSANPILTSLQNFRTLYENLVKTDETGMNPSFDISKALKDSEKIAERKSVVYTTE